MAPGPYGSPSQGQLWTLVPGPPGPSGLRSLVGIPGSQGPWSLFRAPGSQGPWSLLGRSPVPFRAVPGPLGLGFGFSEAPGPYGSPVPGQLWTLGPGPLGPLGPGSLGSPWPLLGWSPVPFRVVPEPLGLGFFGFSEAPGSYGSPVPGPVMDPGPRTSGSFGSRVPRIPGPF